MPNYVKHTLVIVGEQADIDLVCKTICNAEHGGIDFNNIIPMPEILHNVTSPVRIISEFEYKAQEDKKLADSLLGKEERFFTGGGITEKMQKELIKEHGYDNWYDWSCAKWGTKWNACDVSRPEMGDRNGMTTATLHFDTAWSCPFPVLEELSKLFPMVTLEVIYADEDWSNNCGEFELRAGEVIMENIPEMGSDEAKRIATEMWGPLDDDEEFEN